jgi:hypothetical protein
VDVIRFNQEVAANANANEIVFVDVSGGLDWQE